MVDLAVDIGALRLKNPIMPASGTFSEDLADVFDLECLGAHVTKTITRGWRDGNPTPRVCEVSGSMLNSIGIPSKGIGYFIEKTIPFYQRYRTPLVVSISGNTPTSSRLSAPRSASTGWMPSRSTSPARTSRKTARPSPSALLRPMT